RPADEGVAPAVVGVRLIEVEPGVVPLHHRQWVLERFLRELGERAGGPMRPAVVQRLQPAEPVRSNPLHLHASSPSVIGRRGSRVDTPVKGFLQSGRTTSIGPTSNGPYSRTPTPHFLLSDPLATVLAWPGSGRCSRVATADSSSRSGRVDAPAAAHGGRSRRAAPARP